MSKVIDLLNEAVATLGRTELYKDLSDVEKYKKITGITWITEEMLADESLENKLCWLIPAGAAFCNGECIVLTEEELQEILDSIAEGGDVKLTANAKPAAPITINASEPTTLSLGGNTITTAPAGSDENKYGDGINVSGVATIKGGKIDNSQSAPDGAAIMCKKGTDLTLEDVEIVSNGFPIYVNDATAKVTITSGEYTANNSTAALYVGKGATAGEQVVITGGTFKSGDYNGRNYCLNLKDGLSTELIRVKGGTFIGFNPAASMGEPNGPVSFVAEGYKVIFKGDTYKVVAEDAAVPAGWTEYVAPVAEEPEAVEPVAIEEPEAVEPVAEIPAEPVVEE